MRDAGATGLTIRPEADHDRDAIRRVHEAAFATPAEADLVDELRGTDAWIPGLSLVAADGDDVVGHLLMSVARLDRGGEVLALAPIAVLPGRQGTGVGGALVREGLARAASTGHRLVVVLGHPEYYPRFGFTSARAQGILAPFEVSDAAWMSLTLHDDLPRPQGTVVYPPAFGGV